MNTRLLVFTVSALCAGSGWNTTASAQNAAEHNKVIFAVVMNQIFNQGNAALVDDLMAKDVTNNGTPLGRDGFKALVQDLRAKAPNLRLSVDEVVTDDNRVIGRVTQTAGDTAESRIVVLKIDDGLVKEYWSLADEPALDRQFGLRAGPGTQPPASAN